MLRGWYAEVTRSLRNRRRCHGMDPLGSSDVEIAKRNCNLLVELNFLSARL
jgi:hypothetical protein